MLTRLDLCAGQAAIAVHGLGVTRAPLTDDTDRRSVFAALAAFTPTAVSRFGDLAFGKLRAASVVECVVVGLALRTRAIRAHAAIARGAALEVSITPIGVIQVAGRTQVAGLGARVGLVVFAPTRSETDNG